MSTSIKQYQGDNNLGIASVPITIGTAANYTLTNPCPSYIKCNFTTSGKQLNLPAMNEISSIRLGETIVIENIGFNIFSLYASNGTTQIYSAIQPCQTLELTLTDNSTASGTFIYSLSSNGEKILTKYITSPYEVVPDDLGVTFVATTNSGSVGLTARANYLPGFFFNYKLNGDYINNITPHAGDNIDGNSVYSVNANGSVTLFNNTYAGCWSVINEKVGGFNSDGEYIIPTLPIMGLQTTLSDYIVGSSQANYTTISAAITAAISNGASSTNIKMILVKPGTYNENITLHDGIVIRGIDSLCWDGIYLQSVTSQLLSAKLTGTVTYDTSAISADTYSSIQNLWITPATGDAITYFGNAAIGPYSQLLFLDGCRVETTSTNSNCLNLGDCSVTHNNCYFNDNTSGTTGHYYTVAGDGNTVFITSNNSLIITDYGATASVLPSNAAVSIRMINSTSSASVDASSATTYNFRAINFTHISFATNLTPYHVTGASTVGRIIYDNCQVTINDTSINIATIGNSAFIIEFNNTNFGNLQVPSSDVISGGRQILTNCGFQIALNSYYVRNDMIKIGYTGSSKINSQSSLSTSNATPATIGSVVVNEGESITLKGTVTAQKNDSSDSCGGDFLITARRATGGDVTLVGSILVNSNSTSTASFTVDVDTGAQSVRIRVTGIAATTYYWVTDYSYQKVLTSS